MSLLATRFHEFSFENARNVPAVDVRFTACRTGPTSHAFDIIDFKEKRIRRWEIPFFDMPAVVQAMQARIAVEELPLGCKSYQEYYRDHFMTPHVAPISPQGILFVSFGILENGFCIVAI